MGQLLVQSLVPFASSALLASLATLTHSLPSFLESELLDVLNHGELVTYRYRSCRRGRRRWEVRRRCRRRFCHRSSGHRRKPHRRRRRGFCEEKKVEEEEEEEEGGEEEDEDVLLRWWCF